LYILQNVIKKRSLLTRGEKSLAKIASLAKQSDSASYVNTRNFVFPHIDHSNTFKKENESIAEDLDSQIKVYNLITLFKLYKMHCHFLYVRFSFI